LLQGFFFGAKIISAMIRHIFSRVERSFTFGDNSSVPPIFANLYQTDHSYTNLYQPIPTYTNLYQPIPTYTNLYQPIPTYTNLYQPIPTYHQNTKLSSLSTYVRYMDIEKYLPNNYISHADCELNSQSLSTIPMYDTWI
jgi:hypothetical protein